MTVFTRVAGQSLRVGDLVVTVKAIEGNRVLLEFDNAGSDRIQKREHYEASWTLPQSSEREKTASED